MFLTQDPKISRPFFGKKTNRKKKEPKKKEPKKNFRIHRFSYEKSTDMTHNIETL
jgi:hypothetical protein